jgi:hypothetical protein
MTKSKKEGIIDNFKKYKIVTQSLGGLLVVRNKDFEYNNKKYFGAEFKITLPLK